MMSSLFVSEVAYQVKGNKVCDNRHTNISRFDQTHKTFGWGQNFSLFTLYFVVSKHFYFCSFLGNNGISLGMKTWPD